LLENDFEFSFKSESIRVVRLNLTNSLSLPPQGRRKTYFTPEFISRLSSAINLRKYFALRDLKATKVTYLSPPFDASGEEK
jgi:hypothetical protein